MVPAAALAVPPPVGVIFVYDLPMDQVIRDRVPHGVVGSKGVVLGIGGAEIHTVPTVGGPVDEHGLHGRIANIPAEKVSVFADWVYDEYVMKISGEMRESCVFGDNLVLKRTITAKLFEDTITVEDTVINESFEAQNIALCYHCNFGYPLVSETAKLVNIPEEYCEMSAPIHGKEEECISVEYPDDVVRVGIENCGIGAYITYNRSTLPDFVMWKMLGESEYVIGLEPRTARYGGANIGKNNAYVKLQPFTEYKTIVKFSFESLK